MTLRGRGALLLAPLMFAVCGDSPMPGGCGGKPGTPPEKGALACTMRIGGTDVPCRGEWTYWPDERRTAVDLYGNLGEAALPSGKVSVQVWSARAPLELTVGPESWLSADASTSAGKYSAGPAGPGASGGMRLSAVRPPAGTFSGTLVPTTSALGDLGAPAGTTVVVQATF